MAELPEAAPGSLVRIVDARGRQTGIGYLNPRSKIVLRYLARGGVESAEGLWSRRIREAIARRGTYAGDAARRLVNAEGDGAPGVIVDDYAGWLSVQLTTAGSECARDEIVAALAQTRGPLGIYERSDVPERALEGLEQRTGVLWGAEPPQTVEIREGAARLLVDVREGQKTGLFLDQRENRLAVSGYARDARVLNTFAYSGGFSVHAALGGAREVTSVDISAEACSLARRNLELNGFPLDAQRTYAQNAFDFLRRSADERERYDLVIIDPPAFARGRSSLEGALRGYREINLRGLKLLEPGGVLVTCSCSRPVTREIFREVVQRAAFDAKCSVQIVEERGHAGDHPVLLQAPETDYLVCLILRVIA
ncbi:MAG: class I SAM-dependent rRNA methyltransferase [bacterium]|nr:class I SAM-dependent rRNA methyltransferase [bacterium]